MSIQQDKVKKSDKSITENNSSKLLSPKSSPKALPDYKKKYLEEVIDSVNGLPSNPKTWAEIQEEAKTRYTIPIKEFDRRLLLFGDPNPERPLMGIEASINLFIETVEKLKGKSRDYVGEIHPETAKSIFFAEPDAINEIPYENTIIGAIIRYDRIALRRKVLQNIAEKAKYYPVMKNMYSLTGKYPVTGAMLLSTYFNKLEISLYIDEHGLVAIKSDDFIKTIVGIEASTIRVCPVCDNIFLANRKDQKCCSNECANAFRVRRWRENYHSRYKRRRIDKEEMLEKSRSKKGGK